MPDHFSESHVPEEVGKASTPFLSVRGCLENNENSRRCTTDTGEVAFYVARYAVMTICIFRLLPRLA